MPVLHTALHLGVTVLAVAAKSIETLLFVLVRWYDLYIYTPLQTYLWPVVDQIPRYANIGQHKYTIFSANTVSWARTLLVIPIAWCLKYNVCWLAFLLVLFHDFLDHLDGIVAKVQRQKYGAVDDPLLGGFMDAFCDKIVNVLSLWSIVMVSDFSPLSWQQTLLFLGPTVAIMAYEFSLGVVRVQDYFRVYYLRELKKSDDVGTTVDTAAVMEGKLKEKLESMAIAFLCLGQGTANIMNSYSGMVGIVCLGLSIRLAHASLQHKLDSRKKQSEPAKSKQKEGKEKQDDDIIEKEKIHEYQTKQSKNPRQSKSVAVQVDVTMTGDAKTTTSDTDNKRRQSVDKFEMRTHHRRLSLPMTHLDGRVDKVYTVGCFDLFHQGHIKLLQRMKAMGKQVVVGVHDSRSIYNLKKRVPIDNTEQRMINVKRYADVVFCVAGVDPTTFIHCIFNKDDDETALYIRGNDMENFPARELCEALMSVKFLPYTEGVSSTKLRKDLYNSGKMDSQFDDIYLFY